MASSDNAIKIVDSADVEDEGALVKVDSVEKGSMFSFLTGSKKDEDEDVKIEHPRHGSNSEKKEHEHEHEHSSHHKEVVHDGEGIRSTYDVEEDVPLSLLEQLKRKFHWSGR